MGIPVEYSHHELGPSQHEIDLRYTDALDDGRQRHLVPPCREEGRRRRTALYATFMPKPISGDFGSGMHTHLSLFEGDVNAFHDPGDDHGLSKIGKCFIAGLLHHAREITAVTNQWVNSYKRLSVRYEAPVYVCWARNNRSALVRVPVTKKGKESSTRIEFRSPDPACNPYLAFSVILAAGLEGIEQNYDLAPRGHEQHLRAHPRGAGRRGHRLAPRVPRRGHRRDGGLRARRRGARRARLRALRAQQARRVGRLPGPGHPLRADPLPRHPVMESEPLLVFPDPPPPLLAQTLDLAGYRWKAVANVVGRERSTSPTTAGSARSSSATRTRRARSACAGRCAAATPASTPVLAARLGRPARRARAARGPLRRLLPLAVPPQGARGAPAPPVLADAGGAPVPRSSSTATWSLNLETYQAALGDRPLDLTYMEYELLKFFATHPGKVFTREQLLSRVWGYEYYGGARTVDVHVRRLRAKLGEEHAELDPDGALGRVPVRAEPTPLS